jgi:hypothetical protein
MTRKSTTKAPSNKRMCANCGRRSPYKGEWILTYPISQSLPGVYFCCERCRNAHELYTAFDVRKRYTYHNEAVRVDMPNTKLAGYVVAYTDTTFPVGHRYHYMEVWLCRMLLSARIRWIREWEASDLVGITVLQELPSTITGNELLQATQHWRQRLTPVTNSGQETPKPYERSKKRLTK